MEISQNLPKSLNSGLGIVVLYPDKDFPLTELNDLPPLFSAWRRAPFQALVPPELIAHAARQAGEAAFKNQS